MKNCLNWWGQKMYKCDFCKQRKTKRFMIEHEKMCYRNPKRFCYYCENKGFTIEVMEPEGQGSYDEKIDCPYCSRFDKGMLESIEQREAEARDEE